MLGKWGFYLSIFTVVLLVGQGLSFAGTGSNLDQWANDGAVWQNGSLHGGNSSYHEGQGIPFRVGYEGLEGGSSHSFVIEFDFSRATIHGYDYLVDYNYGVDAANVTGNEGVAGGGGPYTIGTPSTYPIPSMGPLLPFAQDPGNFTIYNATIDSTSGYSTSVSGSATAVIITVNFTVNGTAVDTFDVVLLWGGHLASANDWGMGNGASSISGAPLHMAEVNGKDLSMQAGSALPPLPTPTPTATETYTPTNTPVLTDTPTDIPTETYTLTFTPTFTYTLTHTYTFTHTPTFTDIPTDTPTVTDTLTYTPTVTDTLTYTPTVTDTATSTSTATSTATDTPTVTNTATSTSTATSTATDTPTVTNTATSTSTATSTATDTPTVTNTATSTSTATHTFTDTPTVTNTATSTSTATHTFTDTPTSTKTPTVTATFTEPIVTPQATETPTITPTFTEPVVTPQATETPVYCACITCCPKILKIPNLTDGIVTFRIDLPGRLDARDVDLSTVAITAVNGHRLIIPLWLVIPNVIYLDPDGDGVDDVMIVRFRESRILAILPWWLPASLLTLEGDFVTGESFIGSCHIGLASWLPWINHITFRGDDGLLLYWLLFS